MSKTCNIAATLMKSAASPKYRPGQILSSRRSDYRPVHHTPSSVPSTESKYELVWIAHVWIQFAVADKAFRSKHVWVFVYLRIMHACPMKP